MDVPTQEQIDEAATHQRQRLTEAARRLVELRESADWMGNLLDLEDSFTFDREDGVTTGPGYAVFSYSTAFAMGMVYPGDTATAYINEAQLRVIRARSRAFCKTNPYWLGIQHNAATHVVGKGHILTVSAKRQSETVEETLLTDVQDEL